MPKDPDKHYMRRALGLAKRAEGRTSPNPMVGAVIVKDGRIIGKGYHHRAGTPHAEVHALKQAGPAARGATLYVNLEPCSHYGRTPPCAQAVLEAGISRVVAAINDPNPLVAGKGLKLLQDSGISVQVGILEEEARQLNEVFIKHITTGMPFITLKAAMTLDGKIATRTGESRWISGEASRLYVHRLRDRYDAVLVGIGTVLADNPMLTTRLPEGKGRDPVRVIVDSHLRIPLEAQVVVLQESPAHTIIATLAEQDLQKVAALEARGVRVLEIDELEGRVDMGKLMATLGRQGITSVLVEGGAEINASVLRQGIVDKVYFFVAPMLLGGSAAPGPIGGPGADKVAEALRLSKVSCRNSGGDMLISGYALKSDM
ncbi:MAG: bifunctional diaminohydroxyphosphoribosylaminopyrimidine deaminase/5-amino-6-(5-phosphoribosylamino)uracil reductase RibD [Bacillota bacterium]